jgi:hypothetical protein
MQDDKIEPMDAIRKVVHAHLMSLTPEEAKALRARYKLDQGKDAEEADLRALARELASLRKKKR